MSVHKIPDEAFDEDKRAGIIEHYSKVIELLGEDPDREGLIKTPERVAKALQFVTHGYYIDPLEIIRSALFEEDHKEMVIVKDIELYCCASTICCPSSVKRM